MPRSVRCCANLGRQLADIVVRPTSKEEIATVVRAAVRHRLPLTARGGGTANYGQSVPSKGGVVVDMTGFHRRHRDTRGLGPAPGPAP